MIQSYLKQRTFQVSIADVKSEKRKFAAGVPQGYLLTISLRKKIFQYRYSQTIRHYMPPRGEPTPL